MENRIVIGMSYDPWHNLALEEILFEQQAEQQGVTLYLWQNENTVVIGKHQNAWLECRMALLEEEGGKLARRSSGGGAVFHDLGNLNFTFLARQSDYDLKRQMRVIGNAVGYFGIETEMTGRNDLVVKKSGAKFSGNAFRLSNAVGMQHGTILVQTDMDKLGRYLSPAKEKLMAKGVKSVRARVCNLADYSEDVTIDGMKKALQDAFTAEYGPALLMEEASFHNDHLVALREKYASWEWRIGQTPAFDVSLEHRFIWGGITLQLKLQEGHITEAHVFSDAMDVDFIEYLSKTLTGCQFSSTETAARLRTVAQPQATELATWIIEQRL